MSINLIPYSNEYVFGRGRLLVDLFDANGNSTGFRPVGNAPDFTITVKANLFQHVSSEAGLSETDYTQVTSIDRSAAVTIDNITDRNLALAIAGTLSQQAQAATPVTGEIISGVQSGGHYQLGATAGNPSGVRDVSAVTITNATAVNAVARAGSASPVTVGQIYKSGTGYYVVTTAGTTAASAPTYDTTSVGATTNDGTAVVKYLGLVAGTLTVGTDYILDATYGLVGVVPGGSLDKAAAVLPANPDGTPGALSLSAAYTPAAASRTQLKTGDVPQLNGAIKFIADNPTGANRDVFCASVTITPNGDLALITADKNASLSLAIGINKKDSITPAIIIDGQAVLS